jgi:c-di-GMP-related signal transduction protein
MGLKLISAQAFADKSGGYGNAGGAFFHRTWGALPQRAAPRPSRQCVVINHTLNLQEEGAMPEFYKSELNKVEPSQMQVYVARQPIFDAAEKVIGYELLFRSGLENFFPANTDQDFAASKVLLDGFLLIGMDVLLGGQKAFVNFTRKLLVGEAATLFPRDSLVIEVLENIEPDEEVVLHCRKMKEGGYQLALDDFVFEEKWRPLVDLCDIIKVDFLLSSPEECASLPRKFNSGKIKFLAEKVETKEDVERAKSQGYTLFQGYFYSRPKILQGRDIPGYKLNYLQLMREVMHPDMDMAKMGQIIKRDVSLSYKILRFINSAAFSFANQIDSINHALALMGISEIRKWVSLVALSGMGQDKCQELVVSSLVRARFCEMLASRVGLGSRSSDLFLVGMFSLVDAFLDRPMIELVKPLPIAEDVKTALLGGNNKLNTVLQLTVAYEQADWVKVTDLLGQLHLNEAQTPQLYLQSLELANQIFKTSQLVR